MLQSMGLQGVGHDWVTKLNWYTHTHMHTNIYNFSFCQIIHLFTHSFTSHLFIPIHLCIHICLVSLVAQTVRYPPAIWDVHTIPGSGKSPGERNGYPLQYSCLENPMDRGAWQAIGHRVTVLDRTERLTFSLFLLCLETSLEWHIFAMLMKFHYCWHSVQFISVAQLYLTLCDPMKCSTPGLPVHHQFPESTQTHVHWVSDAIRPSHPLSSPSPPALNLSQHWGLFQWVSSLHQSIRVSASASVLPMNTQDWSPLEWTGWISL